MAITYKEDKRENGEDVGTLTIDNGDLKALQTVMEQYNFVDQQAMFRYVLVALLNSSDNKLYIKQDGNIRTVQIAENLIKKSPETSQS